MSEMTIDQAAWMRDFYLRPLKLESATTLNVITAVPPEASGYRPDANARTALDLLRHIAATDNRFIETVLNGVFTTDNLIPESARTPVEIGAWYAERHAANRDRLVRIAANDLVTIWYDADDNPDHPEDKIDVRRIAMAPGVVSTPPPAQAEVTPETPTETQSAYTTTTQEELPRTASPMPLVGALGLLSLAAGVMARSLKRRR